MMKPSVATVVCLTLALSALAQADTELSALTRELRTQLAANEDAVEQLVAEVHTKGPEFEKCSKELIAAKDQAFAAARARMDACQVVAAASLATPPCLTKDVACADRIDATETETLAEAGRCMEAAVRSVDHDVERLTTDILVCDRETAEQFPALPAARRRWKRCIVGDCTRRPPITDKQLKQIINPPARVGRRVFKKVFG